MENRGILIAGMVAALFLGGCASITGDTVQSLRIETRQADGTEVKDADCELFNEHGSFRVKSPGNVTVRRSSTDINIVCKKEDLPNAHGRAISRANAGMFGNIIFGGAIGAVIDHSKGTAYTYPQWMQLVFGKVLSFDRHEDQDGQPSLAHEVGNAAAQETKQATQPAEPKPVTAAQSDNKAL